MSETSFTSVAADNLKASILDIYGMNPGFLEANYAEITPKRETVVCRETEQRHHTF